MSVKEKTEKKQFPVTGMSCAGCAARVETVLNKQDGVLQAVVNLATQTAQVDYLPDKTDAADLRNAVRSIGYDLIIEEKDTVQEQVENLHRKKLRDLTYKTRWAAALSLPLVVIAMFFMAIPYASYIQWAIATPVVIWFGRGFFVNAWKQARHGSANMDTLVALSTGIAYIFSVFNTLFPQFWHSRGLHAHVYFEASAVIITFILLGKLLEEKAKSNTSTALKKLTELQPKTVTRVFAGGHTQEVTLDHVRPGDILWVKPGDKIAVDGVVTAGNSYVDESMITGEPVPVLKDADAHVYAGTINQKGSFKFMAEKVGADTLLSNIIRLVQEAQGSKAPVQKLVDKVAGIFVPSIIVIAIVTFIIWLIAGGENGIAHGLLSMVTVLIIACPCALGLATPTAIMVGIGKGAENNILIKDAEALELACKVDALALDKTGTITEGKPAVEKITWLNDHIDLEQINVLYSLEKSSEHPLADAVVAHLKNQASLVQLQDVTSITGKGITGKYNDKQYYAGSELLIRERNLPVDTLLEQAAHQWKDQANTVIYFADDQETLAVISMADTIKHSSRTAIDDLKKMNIEVYMLTGDNAETARAVALKTGIEHYRADLLPTEKAEFITSLQKQGKTVGMVGDGINDSHALATADISIAMGKGSEIAMDAAGMTIIGNDLNAIPAAIRLSRSTVKTIRQNLFWAFIYNIIGVPLAAGILFPVNGFLLNPMIAGAAMALSSVSVVSNSLRLKLKKIK